MNKRAQIQGFYVDLLDYDGVISKSLDFINENKNVHIVTINPEIIQSAKKRPDLKEIINNAEIITPDGVGVKLALKFKGINQNQVTGVDLSYKMLKICEEKGLGVAFVGAKNEILELAISKIKERYPNINIVYFKDGYFDDFENVTDSIVQSGAKLILCAMGSPKQEYFISKLKSKINGAIMIGVGGTFDVMSGKIELAPKIIRKIGLEWLYRTIKEPKRFKRIFPTLPIFFFQSIIDSISKNK